VNALLV